MLCHFLQALCFYIFFPRHTFSVVFKLLWRCWFIFFFKTDPVLNSVHGHSHRAGIRWYISLNFEFCHIVHFWCSWFLFSSTAEILLHGYVMVNFKKDKKKPTKKSSFWRLYLTVLHTGNFNCAPKANLSVLCFCIVCSWNRLLNLTVMFNRSKWFSWTEALGGLMSPSRRKKLYIPSWNKNKMLL